MNVEESNESAPSVGRIAAALVVLLAVAIYMYAIVGGHVPKDRRLDGIDVVVLALASSCAVLILRPNALARLRLLELKGFKVELLEKVRERQLQQEVELEDIRLIIPLLLPETERKHLRNLASGAATSYKGNHALRAELRRLRSIGLKFLGAWDQNWLSAVEYKRLDEGYELNLTRGWVGTPELAYPPEFWNGLGVRKTNVKRAGV